MQKPVPRNHQPQAGGVPEMCFSKEARGEVYCIEISLNCQVDLSGPLWPIWVCQGYHHKIPQNEQLRQQKSVFSKFWRLDVQGQGTVRVGLW